MASIRHRALAEVPPANFIANLLKTSVERNDWKVACREWTPIGLIKADAPDYDGPPSTSRPEFQDNCDLCGRHLYRENCIIQNVLTGEKLTVGSDCVYRFDALHDVSHGDVATFLDRWMGRQELGPVIRMLAIAFKTTPIDRQACTDFVNNVRKVFGSINTIGDWEAKKGDLLGLCEVPDGSVQSYKIRDAFLAPNNLALTRREGAKRRVKSEDELRRELYGRKSGKGQVHIVSAGRDSNYTDNRLDRKTKE